MYGSRTIICMWDLMRSDSRHCSCSTKDRIVILGKKIKCIKLQTLINNALIEFSEEQLLELYAIFGSVSCNYVAEYCVLSLKTW